VDVLALGFVAAAICTLFGDVLGRFAETLFAKTTTFRDLTTQSLAELGLIVVAVVLLHRASGTRIRHLRNALAYPPMAFAVIFGLLSLPLWTRLLWSSPTAISWSLAAGTALFYLIVWFAQILFGRSHTEVIEAGSSAGTVVPDDARKSWLRREDPVDRRSADLFGFAPIADSLLARLEGNGSTVALLGPYGSGKSSVGRIAAREAAERGLPLIFAQTSCWGFEDAETAQKEVLGAVLRAVGGEADCLAIRQLPVDYVEAVGAQVGWLRSFLKVWGRERGPLEQLRRISPILAALGKRVVVVIEDVDRAGEQFDISRVQSLLMQLREVQGLSFILAVSPMHRIDFAKICDHLETMPRLERGQVLELIDQIREWLLREFPPGEILSQLEPLGTDNDYRALDQHLEYYWPWQLSLCELLDSPRLLKHALRRLAEAWPHLRGEVHFDHLISIVALRVGAPEAFTFFCDRLRLFEAAMKKADPQLRESARIKLKEDLQEEWRRLSETGRFDPRSAAGLMRDIYPPTAAVTGFSSTHRTIVQSMHSQHRQDVYGRRLMTERCEADKISDQRMISLIKRSAWEPTAVTELAREITRSEFASAAFAHLARPLGFKQTLPLLTEVYAVLRVDNGNRAHMSGVPGVFEAARMVDDLRPECFEAWLIKEMTKCAPGHLRLLNDIYHFWVGTNQHTLQDRDAPRKALLESLKIAWSQIAPESIADGFDPRYLYTLFHLIKTADYVNPSQVPFGTFADWAWSAEPLLKAARARHGVILPQILIALNKDEQRGSEILKYDLNREGLSEWFGDRAGEVLELAAQGCDLGDMDVQMKYLVNLAITCVRQLNETPKPPASGATGQATPPNS